MCTCLSPVADKVYVEAVKPYLDEKLDANTALARAAVPVRGFMFEQTRESDITLFTEMSGHDAYKDKDDVPFTILAPSFISDGVDIGFDAQFVLLGFEFVHGASRNNIT